VFSSDAYFIRRATPDDASLLLRLSVLDSQRALSTPALIGEIDGEPAAAISLETGRVVADPFVSTAALVAHLRLRASAVQAPSETARRQRVRAGIKLPLVPRYRT
jgi:hypothetical protein